MIVLIVLTRVSQDGVEVHVGDSRTRYYTYHPGRALPYSKEGCSKLQMVEPTWTSDDLKEESDMAESVTEGALEAGDVPNIDDDDEYENTVEHLSSGIKDILITGKVSKLPKRSSLPIQHISTDYHPARCCMGPLHVGWPGEWCRIYLIAKHELNPIILDQAMGWIVRFAAVPSMSLCHPTIHADSHSSVSDRHLRRM